jgi:hypothetical protein
MKQLLSYFISLSQLIAPLHGLFAPTTQIPICLTPVPLDVSAFIFIVEIENESIPIPIIKINAITAIACFGFVCLFLFDVSFLILALMNAFQHKST